MILINWKHPSKHSIIVVIIGWNESTFVKDSYLEKKQFLHDSYIESGRLIFLVKLLLFSNN